MEEYSSYETITWDQYPVSALILKLLIAQLEVAIDCNRIRLNRSSVRPGLRRIDFVSEFTYKIIK